MHQPKEQEDSHEIKNCDNKEWLTNLLASGPPTGHESPATAALQSITLAAQEKWGKPSTTTTTQLAQLCVHRNVHVKGKTISFTTTESHQGDVFNIFELMNEMKSLQSFEDFVYKCHKESKWQRGPSVPCLSTVNEEWNAAYATYTTKRIPTKRVTVSFLHQKENGMETGNINQA
eukprot:TRINITY_DN67759_c5_g3_i2.p1 TRINITY_DN67759_c5_g3~~TRINITY_DN67759_c5_g3_i2.p1  ORF type:complete len:175 (+),score=15.22 TRINITY_DN67759_c5_g3_i2:50-574(+)